MAGEGETLRGVPLGVEQAGWIRLRPCAEWLAMRCDGIMDQGFDSFFLQKLFKPISLSRTDDEEMMDMAAHL